MLIRAMQMHFTPEARALMHKIAEMEGLDSEFGHVRKSLRQFVNNSWDHEDMKGPTDLQGNPVPLKTAIEPLQNAVPGATFT